MCDYDRVGGLPSSLEVLKLARRLGMRVKLIEDHRTARGWHRTVWWHHRFQPAEIVAIQLLLGSDPGREGYNLMRLLAGATTSKRWNLLFEYKL